MYNSSTHQHQSSLANYCRTGVYKKIPGVNEIHVKQYRRLVYNVIDDTLATAYPLTKALLTETEWDEVVQDFFSSSNCSSPQIWKMPKELFEFLEDTNHAIISKYPFILELLYFEWLEIEVYMMEDEEVSAYQLDGNLFEDKLYLNPEFRIQALKYPVHTKVAKEIHEEDEGQFFVLIHRDPENGKVIFTELSYAHLLLIDRLSEEAVKLTDLQQIWKQAFKEEDLESALLAFIENSIKTKLILGFI